MKIGIKVKDFYNNISRGGFDSLKQFELAYELEYLGTDYTNFSYVYKTPLSENELFLLGIKYGIQFIIV